ncbi:MAG: dTMP kinase [Candidatus Vogelbacteria bacterium]|nr:dTMP kinase [Candidatus Vogelbacteria bacterium]
MKETKIMENKTRGKFIVVEGGEGSGKGTCIENLKLHLPGDRVYFTREPGGTPFAEDTRKVLLAKRGYLIDPKAELLLAYGARIDHLGQVVIPKTKSGIHVISDRFYHSSDAYQIYGPERFDLVPLSDFLKREVVTLKPDLCIFLDLDTEKALERMRARGQELDHFESKDIEYHKRVRQGYLKSVEEGHHQILHIDDMSKDEVVALVLKTVKDFLEL